MSPITPAPEAEAIKRHYLYPGTLFVHRQPHLVTTVLGACVAVCPENAINVQGWTLRQYEDMVDMIVADDLAA